MQRIQNYFHIRNSIAWSCFFREIWVRVVEQGGEREGDGLDCFFSVCLFVCLLAFQKNWPAFQKSGTAFQVLADRLMAPIIMSDGVPQRRPFLWQILWSNIKWCLASQHWWHIRRCWWHITEIMCMYQNDGTTQRLCACTKTMAHHRDYVHVPKRWHNPGCDGTSVNGICCTQA